MHWFLVLALALMQAIPDEYHSRPVRPDHVMDEQEADSLVTLAGGGLALGIETMQGLPAGKPERDAFLEGFRQAFLEKEFATERVARRSGAVTPGPSLRERVRLADGEEESAWGARIRLEWWAPIDSAADSLARAWPGRAVRVTVTLAPPEDAGRARPGAPAEPAPLALRFPPGHPVDAPYLHNAGRQVGLVVIEALARARGALPEDRRLALEGARRLAPADAARAAGARDSTRGTGP